MIKYKYCKLLCSLEVLIIDLDKMRVDANLTYFVYYYFNKFKKLFYSENENDKLSKSIMDDYINELKKKGTPKNRHNGNQKRYYGNKVGGGVMHTSIKANVAT